MSLDPLTSIIISPKNDVESLTIVSLAEALHIPCIVSAQPHGATLDAEPNLVDRIRETNPVAHDIVIVEMPNVSTEDKLRELGFDVHVVDHHRYESLDRMKKESSLEQIRVLFDMDDTTLRIAGFDPVLIRGVGLIDRGFVWELAKENVPEADRKRMIAHYREQNAILDPDQAKEEKAAMSAWKKREEIDGVIVVTIPNPALRIREAISFLAAQDFSEAPVTVIYQPGRIVYIQETPTALALQQTFGGFTFGQNLCWGKPIDADGNLPTVDEVIAAHRLALLTN